MLFGVSKFEPAILIGSLALLVTVSVAAALVPAFRAASIDPMRAVQTG
jgi:ABC-type antimicrobial peptide transport system permease subunit